MTDDDRVDTYMDLHMYVCTYVCMCAVVERSRKERKSERRLRGIKQDRGGGCVKAGAKQRRELAEEEGLES